MQLLTTDQREFVDEVRTLAEREFADEAYTWEGDVPWKNIETLREAGLYGVNLPEEYGGRGLSDFEAMLLVETVGRVCPDTGYLTHNQHFTAPRSINHLGTDAAKEKYLPLVTEDNEFIAFAISEPGAGSDVSAIETTAEDVDGGVVVDGEKTWVGNASKAAAAVVWTKFDDGLGSVVVDFETADIEIVNRYENMAGQEQTRFEIHDAFVPEEDVLARGRDGFLEQIDAINWDRVGCAAIANAQAACAIDLALDYAQEREQFGQKIGEFQGIEWKFADAVTQLEASRALTYTVTRNAVERGGSPERMHAAMLALFSANMVETVASEALQVHGAQGYQRGNPIEYLYRVARRWRLAGGTDEIQRNNIADVLADEGTSALF
jgi:alkylation response protein AidB-like acyl-CoA dehydrogenase